MGNLSEIPLAIGGGMWDVGDGNKAPEPTTRLQSNLTQRAGSLVKRKALRFEKTLSTFGNSPDYIDLAIGGFGVRRENNVNHLHFAFYDANVHVRTYERSGGDWVSRMDFSTEFYIGNEKLGLTPWREFILMHGRGIPVCSYSEGSGASYGFINLSQNKIPYYGTCSHLAIYFQRFMMSKIGVGEEAVQYYGTQTTAGWTTTNITINSFDTSVPFYTHKRKQLEVTGATPTVTFDLVDRTGLPLETDPLPVIGSVDFYIDKSALTGVPITLEIIKHDGTATYGSQEYTLPSSAENQKWLNYQVSATVPASTNYKLRLKLYNASGTAAVGDLVTVLDTSPSGGRSHVPLVTLGHNNYTNPNIYFGAGSWVGPWIPFDSGNLTIWSEIGEPVWTSTAFYKALEEPGDVTGVHVLETKLLITKENALWWFGYSTDPDIAIQMEGFSRGVGATAKDGVAVYKGRVMCVNKNGLYAISPGAPPELLIHEGMRKKIFEENTAPRMLCVDEVRGILYMASTTKLWAMEIDSGAISEVSIPAGINIGAMAWGKFDTDTDYCLRIAYLFYNGSTYNINIASFSGVGNKDSASGSDVNVDAKYIFHTIQTPSPIKSIMVHFLELDHEITSGNASDTFTLELSHDDGVGWTNLGNYNISQITSGGDTQVLSFPVNRAVKRALFRITHSGGGGEEAFNFNGARLLVTGLGRAQRPATPTRL